METRNKRQLLSLETVRNFKKLSATISNFFKKHRTSRKSCSLLLHWGCSLRTIDIGLSFNISFRLPRVNSVRWDNIISTRYSIARDSTALPTLLLELESYPASVTKNRFNTASTGLSAAVISRTTGFYLYFPFISRSAAYDRTRIISSSANKYTVKINFDTNKRYYNCILRNT